MNNLNDDVLDNIYKYKHHLEFQDVLKELIQHKINCRFNVSIDALKYMFYLNERGVKVASLDVSSIEVFAHEILDRIKCKRYVNSI